MGEVSHTRGFTLGPQWGTAATTPLEAYATKLDMGLSTKFLDQPLLYKYLISDPHTNS